MRPRWLKHSSLISYPSTDGVSSEPFSISHHPEADVSSPAPHFNKWSIAQLNQITGRIYRPPSSTRLIPPTLAKVAGYRWSHGYGGRWVAWHGENKHRIGATPGTFYLFIMKQLHRDITSEPNSPSVVRPCTMRSPTTSTA
ncbi:hypothetical protein VFPPC_15393 [Pochonia chlamydosporia 170]|uniref:Uncharacterized protein n=1 Tax=Pochonia chlamydosporia 170 TaxID=1380566 RepID=A0A179G857_METCM|nr:hypothetical protein VFPPC_15393 [Pochonia chlamydosporia 170]OAQ73986.1 hypothetical protein VFPPC_15393 [Pochonia chlamydosporia 170]